MVVVDILFQWMTVALGKVVHITQFSSQVVLAGTGQNTQICPTIFTSNVDYQSFLRDLRLKIIALKALRFARKDPVLRLEAKAN